MVQTKVPDIEVEGRDTVQRLTEVWFNWMDHVLDFHRNNCLFRQPNAVQLEEHKRLLSESIQSSLVFNAIIAAPAFNEPALTARLQVRIQQLQDAYNTFHDPSLSDEQAQKFLSQIFPE